MKIHNASNGLGYLPAQGPSNNRAASFKALATALQNGDVSGAQTAFAALRKGRAQTSNAAPGTEGSNPVEQDLNNLQTALQKGDLSSAQQAFSSIQQDFQKMQGVRGHHHRHADGDEPSAQATAPTSTATLSPFVYPTATSGTILNTTA